MTETTDGLSDVKLHLVDSVEMASKFLAWASERRPYDAVGVDIETGEIPGNHKDDALSPWHGNIRLVQVGDGMQGWAIPWDEWSGVFYEFTKNFSGPVVCHNIAFEARWFAVKSKWNIPWHNAHDTMIMAHLIDPIGSVALKRLASLHVDPRSANLQATLSTQLAENGWTWGTTPIDFAPYWCVPLDTEILTRSGWKTHSKLEPGDETLGYKDGLLAWTDIQDTQTFKNAPLVTVGNSYWSTTCTPQHRWVYESQKYLNGKYDGYGEAKVGQLDEIWSSKHNRLVLSALAEGGESTITPDEAAVIAWLLSDGTIYWQNPETSPIASITQHPKKFASQIRDLLMREGAYVSEKTQESSGCIRFYVRSGYVSSLWKKANLFGKDYSGLVLALSQSARAAWWDAWYMAEGSYYKGKKNNIISQNFGPKFDALVLTAYLEGFVPRIQKVNDTHGKIQCGTRKPTPQKTSLKDAGRADVWCPVTGLGTWTARDKDGRVFVTGNTYGALDPVITMRLWEKFYKECGPGGQYEKAYELEMATRKIATRMEINGARVDLDYSKNKYDELIDYTEKVKEWASKKYEGTSITSNPQLVRLVDRLGGVITEVTPSGQKSASKEQMEKLIISGNSEVKELATAVLQQRKAAKLASTYFSNFMDKHVDGVLHPSIRTLGARTGRMAMSDPALQTLPTGDATVRRAFIPRDEDHVIISSDLDQVEFRLTAAMSHDPQLIGLFKQADETGGDAFTEILRDIYQDPAAQKSDPRRQLVKGCVPLSSQILTKRGWLTYDEVTTRDETLGYNFESRQSEWTKVEGVHVYKDSDVFLLHNSHKSFLCTEDHRWVADNGRGGDRGITPKIVYANEIPGTETRIILAAPAEDGQLDISPKEASVLGWVLGDGSISRKEFVGGPSQGVDGWRVGCQMSIFQTKKKEIKEIDNLLEKIPNTRWTNKKTKQVKWSIGPDFSRELLTRAEITDKKNFDPWKLAYGMSLPARQAMIDALDAADGKNKKEKYVAIVQAADSPVAELLIALGYLTGKFSRSTTYKPDGKNWQRKDIKIVWHQKATMGGQKTSLDYASTEDVWCVTTGLGTWTMRQSDGVPVLTGNTVYGKLYGAGVAKMALTAGVPEEQMKSVVDAFDRAYPGVKQLQKQIEDIGTKRLNAEGQGYVRTITGRRLPCDDDRVYSLTNYLVQASAAEVFKMNLVKMDMADLTELMIVPVHDEIVLQAPRKDVQEIMKTVQECMTTNEGWSVPLTAGVDGPFENWGQKYE